MCHTRLVTAATARNQIPPPRPFSPLPLPPLSHRTEQIASMEDEKAAEVISQMKSGRSPSQPSSLQFIRALHLVVRHKQSAVISISDSADLSSFFHCCIVAPQCRHWLMKAEPGESFACLSMQRIGKQD